MGTLDNRHTIALPYWARPGFMLAAGPDDGGDDPELEDDEDEDDDEEDEDDDEDGDKSIDDLKAELKTTRDALKRTAGQSKKRRQALQRQRKEAADALAAASRKKPAKKSKDDEDDDRPDADEIRRQAREEAKIEADTRTKKGAIRAALGGAGIPKERIGRLAGMIDLEDLDVDDDGEVDGLDDAIDGLRDDFPELFGRTRRRRPGNTGPKDDEGDKRKKLSTSEAQARALAGK